MNTLLLSLDGFAQTLNRDDMPWFHNEFSDAALTRTSIRRSLNQRPRAEHLLTNGLSPGCEPPGFGGKGELYLPPRKLADNLRCLVPYDNRIFQQLRNAVAAARVVVRFDGLNAPDINRHIFCGRLCSFDLDRVTDKVGCKVILVPTRKGIHGKLIRTGR